MAPCPPPPPAARFAEIGAEERCGDDRACGHDDTQADQDHPRTRSKWRMDAPGARSPSPSWARLRPDSTVLGGSAVFEAANALLAKIRAAAGGRLGWYRRRESQR